MHLGSRGIALFLERATKPDLGAPGQHEESSTSRPARAARQEVHGVRGGGHRPASAVSPSLDGARSGWGRGSNLSYPPARTRRTSPNRDERRRGCPRAFPIAGVERFAVCPRVVFRIAEVVERRPDLAKRRARGQPLPAWPEVSPLAIRRGGERNDEKPCGDGKVTRTAEDPRRVLHDGRRPGSGKLSVFTDRRWKRSRLSPRVSSANAGWQPDPPRGGREPGWRARQGRPEVGSYARERRRKCLPRRRTGSLRRARCRETPGSPGTACVVQATRGRSREIDETRVLVAVLGSRSRQEASTVVVHGAPQGEPGHARPGPEPSLDAVDAAEGAQGSGERVCGARKRHLSRVALEHRERERRLSVLRYDSRCLWIPVRFLLHRRVRIGSSPSGSTARGSRKTTALPASDRSKSIGGARGGPRETSESGLHRERLVQLRQATEARRVGLRGGVSGRG